ncbi:hypothetical protein Tco_1079208 [Tanacetum coccineum]|uniref:Retrovirus-related Pol polyprotein from transposon TNT 1-94-like beta-barrel domain-containing protein n=1 Tax=Tanacetum coccineum TaxID=301880 RepID=A0ABQ5HR35_9ASTR
MDSDKYLEGQSMQRPPLFESDSFIYWKNRFETYVKSKDLDLWHVITNGDIQPIQQNPETKLDEVIPFEKQSDDLKRKLAKNNQAKMVIYNALPRKEYERIFMCNTAKEIWKTLLITHQDSAFARFNTIFTSLKALDEGYSSKNYVRKFLRALHLKWRAKVTAMEELKDLTSLSLDELIRNLKVHEMIIKKDSEIVKAKGERKYFALKAKKESSDEECSTSRSEDEEYPWRLETSRSSLREEVDSCGDPNHLIEECPKPPKDKNQRAFVGGSWGDSGEEDIEKVKDETCLVAQASSEICLGVDLEPDEWIKDSGCSKHMTGNQKLFSSYKAYGEGNVIFGSNLRGIIGKGQICDNKCRVTFSEHDSEITKDGKVIGREFLYGVGAVAHSGEFVTKGTTITYQRFALSCELLKSGECYKACSDSEYTPPMLDRNRLLGILANNMGTVSDVVTGGTEGALQQGPVRARVLNDLSTEEKERYKANIRATNIHFRVYQRTSLTHQSLYRRSKPIWENVKKILEGSETGKLWFKMFVEDTMRIINETISRTMQEEKHVNVQGQSDFKEFRLFQGKYALMQAHESGADTGEEQSIVSWQGNRLPTLMTNVDDSDR